MDDRGRITIPEYLRDALGIPKEPNNFPLIVEAYPNLKNCKTLFVKKGH